MKQIHFFRDYLIEKYGQPMQRISLDPGFSCPHRNSYGKGGCAFCSEDGSRAQHLTARMSLPEQVRTGIQYLGRRYDAKPPYIAYFQAFTGTNAPVEVLRKVYREALALADFKVVIIATRPDCLPEECLDFLEELAQEYELWVELGVQTANDETLERINRGHDFAAVEQAVHALDQRGIKVAAHLILGLPGEELIDFIRTARKIAALPFSAVKMHNLLVLKGTAMAKLWEDGLVKPMNEYEYAEALSAFLRELPDEMMLMRISSEAREDQVLAPKWWMKKGQFLDMFLKLYQENDPEHPDAPKSIFHAFQTADGSYTLYHPQYRQHFHSVAGAWEESLRKYLEPCHVKEKLEAGQNVSLLDVGFGMGYNACAAVQLAEELRQGKIYILSLEADQNVLSAALNLPGHKGLEILQAIQKDGRYESPYASIELMWGDARDSVKLLKAHYDFIFMDGFSSDANPELWTLEFVKRMYELLKNDGYLASYSSAYPYLGALMEAGFHLFESKAFGRRKGGIVAAIDANPWLPPVMEKDFLITTKSTAGIPYRDPGLKSTREEILTRRKAEVAERRKKGMPKWYK